MATLSSLLLLCYVLQWQPMEAPHYDFLCTFNEVVCCMCCYLILLFTDFVPEPELRYSYGGYFLILLYVNLAVNLLVLGYEIAR